MWGYRILGSGVIGYFVEELYDTLQWGYRILGSGVIGYLVVGL